ncbi:tetratricopeptide (TPR) repeat protein [Evansella vedderi]|uniref:Tetratricopeptide (TPR) repeat protein n=1 Tax=Evansella vedderi TaxID=38282 RepID=A0ABT9ZTW2_9BACI|nr:AimR family lysis-lysogeny pheromone receptor [Evansella vedderi]MDQ0254686.1 tetratricopeptide (TPR) repeat protein [Evansella vedderi]
MVEKQTSDDLFRSTENIEQSIKELDPNSYLARVSLEYAVSNSKIELLEYLIEKLSHSSSEESKKWAEIYNIDNLVCKNEISLIESTNRLTYITCNSQEMSILRKIFQLYNYYDLKAFQMIEILSDLINEEIKLLDEGYMKDSLQSRLDLAMQSVHLHLNQLEKSRSFGQNIIKIAPTPIMRAIAFKNLGTSYILENYNESINYFNQSLNILNNIQRHQEIHNIKRLKNFVRIYWGHTQKVEFVKNQSITDHLIVVFSLIKNGDEKSAIESLKNVESNLQDDFTSGYYYYYLGLATKEEKYFYESIKFFSKSGDHFFRQLPLLALKEKGVDTMLLSALSV